MLAFFISPLITGAVTVILVALRPVLLVILNGKRVIWSTRGSEVRKVWRIRGSGDRICLETGMFGDRNVWRQEWLETGMSGDRNVWRTRGSGDRNVWRTRGSGDGICLET